MPAKVPPKGGAAAKAPAKGAKGTPKKQVIPQDDDPSQPSPLSGVASHASDSQVSEIAEELVDLPDLGAMNAQDWLEQQKKVEEYIEHDREWVPFRAMVFDETMTEGQCRKWNPLSVIALRKSMVINPQRNPLEQLLFVRNPGVFLLHAQTREFCST